jgi:hypothetical protein
MKVYISKYRYHWISPYTILEKVCFWEKDKDVFYNLEEKPDHKYEKWVNLLTPVCQGLQKFLDFIHPKIDYVKIDKWDTWSMDHTLGKIILPMLKQLQETKHGAPCVDDEDVPDELKSTSAPPKENEWDTDGNHFKRWDWVMNEMIFAFERLNDDSWEDNFRSGEIDWKHVPCAWDENGKPTMYKTEEGPNHTYECDYDAIEIVNKRMDNGFRLFGKYYRGLWD